MENWVFCFFYAITVLREIIVGSRECGRRMLSVGDSCEMQETWQVCLSWDAAVAKAEVHV